MAGTPLWKIYNPAGEYIAACKFGEDAACLVALNGPGSTIRPDHAKAVWTEGAESQSAAESYDFVANTIGERLEARRNAARARLGLYGGGGGS